MNRFGIRAQARGRIVKPEMEREIGSRKVVEESSSFKSDDRGSEPFRNTHFGTGFAGEDDSYKQSLHEDNSYRQMQKVEEAAERDEFDLPVSSKKKKIKIKTHVFVQNAKKETANFEDHLTSDLNNNMNLLFYNFNNSRCNTASAGKRAPSLGLEREREQAMGALANNVQVNSIPLEKLMYSTDFFKKTDAVAP